MSAYRIKKLVFQLYDFDFCFNLELRSPYITWKQIMQVSPTPSMQSDSEPGLVKQSGFVFR